MQRLAALIAALAFAAALAGCGGGDDGITTSSLSKAEFTKQANAICEEAREKALAYRPPNEQGSEKQIVTASIQGGILPEIQRAMEEVRELGAPEGDEDQVEAVIAGNEEHVEAAEGKSFGSLTEMEEVFKPTVAKARAYGIDACAF